MASRGRGGIVNASLERKWGSKTPCQCELVVLTVTSARRKPRNTVVRIAAHRFQDSTYWHTTLVLLHCDILWVHIIREDAECSGQNFLTAKIVAAAFCVCFVSSVCSEVLTDIWTWSTTHCSLVFHLIHCDHIASCTTCRLLLWDCQCVCAGINEFNPIIPPSLRGKGYVAMQGRVANPKENQCII
jgi:hypothetical protein